MLPYFRVQGHLPKTAAGKNKPSALGGLFGSSRSGTSANPQAIPDLAITAPDLVRDMATARHRRDYILRQNCGPIALAYASRRVADVRPPMLGGLAGLK